MTFIYAFNWINELRQLCIKMVLIYFDSKSFLEETGTCYQLDPLVLIKAIRFLDEVWIRMLFNCWLLPETTKVSMKTKKNLKKKLKIRSNWSLVRLVCARIGLWSGKFQTIVQTKVRSKPFPDHVIRAHREHVCAWNSSDQGSLRSGHLDLGIYYLLICLFNN